MGEKKRSLPPKVAAMKARKRQKLDPESTHHATSTTKVRKDGPEKRRVNLNSLAWKEISLPDRMEDYEGFFGLEEIEDVEVHRDETTGMISYLAGDVSGVANGAEPHDANEDSGGSSWEGFDDEEPPAPLLQKREAKTKAVKEKKLSKLDAKPKPTTNGHSEPKPAQNGHFDALMGDAEDEGVDVSAWRSLKLSPDTMASLSKLKFSKPTPIQQAVIPQALEGQDVVGKASTGSGKTLAFGIPILERFLETASKRARGSEKAPMALILSPTRELAYQLNNHLTALFSGVISTKPAIATITGGLSLHKQQRLLKDADVVIGTPGRLWEIISGGQGVMAALKQIEFLIVDEADRLLSEGHFKEVEEILNSLDREDTNEEEEDDKNTTDRGRDAKSAAQPFSQRQTLVFSATFDRALQKKLVGKLHRRDNLLGNKETMEYLLSKLNFRSETPQFIDVNPVNQLATGLKEGLVECGGTEKDLYLYAVLLLNQTSRAMVFTNSISAVRRITPLLQNLNINALALHSGMPQKARLRSIERFTDHDNKSKKSTPSSPVVLVATDVAARGLDIPNVDLVLHYHLPRAADTYVHRSGRTARAGQQGSSILLCAPEEVAGVRRLIAKVHATTALHHNNTADDAKRQGYYIRTLDIDRRLVSRLKPRAMLAKKLADAVIAKEKQPKEDDLLRTAAEELGVEYDSDDFENEWGKQGGRRGRGAGRKKKEREARGLTKAEMAGMKAELKGLLSQRVNVGVSEKYLTSGDVDVGELLRQQDEGKKGEFLGRVGGGGLLEDL